ncbi:MAG: hypothetical protein IJA88_02190 [Clostridia bacterium]|nr:hypothetical protein [Clostridia bacterium]
MKTYKGLKIATAILFVFSTMFVGLFVTDILIHGQHILTGIALFIWVNLAIFALAVPMVVSVVGAIITFIKWKKQKCGLGTFIYFVIFTFLPILVYFCSITAINIIL